ncbi:expressed unknown protein [Seminavis robusta]|uniref:Uncharacterized protein n=1 Tax=Seminavis robusta TaxID=568900 RepID=A0A9N8DMY2_9STRA|nr:expressed unknown protein [Seminavis robusta]|eukprot:Sro250_g099040.1 n/a (227) ;mRNA; r:45520-46200
MISAIEQQQSTQQVAEKRVHFAGSVEYMIPRDELTAESWYEAEEMKQLYREDVVTFLREYKNNLLKQQKEQQRQQEEESPEDSDSEDEDSDSDDESDSEEEEEEEEEEEPVCSRGLEMYFPGQLAARRKLRAKFASKVLCKYQEYREIFCYEDAQELLCEYASEMGVNTQKKAHALALQDALEARLVHAEGDESTTTATKDAISDFVPLIRHESRAAQTTCKARAA